MAWTSFHTLFSGIIFFCSHFFVLCFSTLCPTVDGHRSHLWLSPRACKSGEVQQLLLGPECLHHGPVSQTQERYTLFFFFYSGNVINLLFLAWSIVLSEGKSVFCATERRPQQILRWLFMFLLLYLLLNSSNCKCNATLVPSFFTHLLSIQEYMLRLYLILTTLSHWVALLEV